MLLITPIETYFSTALNMAFLHLSNSQNDTSIYIIMMSIYFKFSLLGKGKGKVFPLLA
jgi:hypothetical protein